MAEKKITMTKEGYEKLVAELRWREGEERERIKQAIVVARGFGDLSENAEYDAARNEQTENEARIQQLKADLEKAEIHDASKVEKGVVTLGSVVKVKDAANGREFTFRIVGSNEADARNGKISDISPVGRALIDHRAGDTVTDTVEASGYTFTYEIIEVTRD